MRLSKLKLAASMLALSISPVLAGGIGFADVVLTNTLFTSSDASLNSFSGDDFDIQGTNGDNIGVVAIDSFFPIEQVSINGLTGQSLFADSLETSSIEFDVNGTADILSFLFIDTTSVNAFVIATFEGELSDDMSFLGADNVAGTFSISEAQINAIPLPAGALLLATGLAGIGAFRNKKKS